MVLILVLSIVPAKANANTGYDHNALLEYKGYGETMYESIVEETTFITGQYTDNKQFVGDSINEIKDYANFWLNEQKKINNSCGGMSLFTKSCAGEMVTSGGGYLLTVGDWVKKLFGDYDETLPINDVDYSFYENAFSLNVNNQLSINDGWSAVITTPNGNVHHMNKNIVGALGLNITYVSATKYKVYSTIRTNTIYTAETKIVEDASLKRSQLYELTNSSVGGFISVFYSEIGGSIKVFHNGTEINASEPNRPSKEIIKYLNENNPKLVVPEPKPSLVCSDGTRIEMSINGSTFLGKDGAVMVVNKDGTSLVNGTSCNLDWKTPEMGYKDGKTVIEDKDNNLIDMLTGEILCMLIPGKECLLDTIEKEKDKDKNEIKELDTSLLQYIKNAYKYATESLKVATDGLKSLANGAKDLTSLFGIFFSWLPREMVVLMSSGLGLMIALRLFRK